MDVYSFILKFWTVGLVSAYVGAARAAQLFKTFSSRRTVFCPNRNRIFPGDWHPLGHVFTISEECDSGSGSGSCVAFVWTHRPSASVENEGTGWAGSAGTGSDLLQLPGSPSRRTCRVGSRDARRQRNRGGGGLCALWAGTLPGDPGLSGRTSSGPVRLLYGVR